MNNGSNQILEVLTREGVLINVSVRFWRGCKKLKAEDVGLNPDDVSDRLISLGHKRLLPKDALAELSLIEGRAHALIDANTFPFLNGVGHFLPNTKLEEVTGKLKEMELEFWDARTHFLQRYARLRRDAAQEWRLMAEKLVKDPEQLMATIEASFPDPDHMGRFFSFDTSLFQITVPKKCSVEMIAMGDHQAIIKARAKAAADATEKIKRDTERFIADSIASLREQTAQLCDEILQSINGGKTEGVHQKTLNRLVKFIDQFKSLNFANDSEMEEQLEKVRKELLSKTAQEYRDDSLAHRQLIQGVSKLRDTARELATQDAAELVQRFGELGRRRLHLAA
jgi:hypothetical protein